MVPLWVYRTTRRRHPDVTQIQLRIARVQHMVVIGKADELPVRAKNVNVGAATQRTCRVRRSDIHRIKIAHLTIVRNHP